MRPLRQEKKSLTIGGNSDKNESHFIAFLFKYSIMFMAILKTQIDNVINICLEESSLSTNQGKT